MADATLTVEIAFDAGPKDALSTATWTDITTFVDEVDISRGRQRKLTRIEAGTCTVRLQDDDGRFNPANTASPYYPNVKPNRRIRVTATYDLVDYVLFSGFVDRWPQAWPESEFVPVTIEASDGFKILANKDLPASTWVYEVTEDSPLQWWRFADTAGATAVNQGEADRVYDGTYTGGVTLGVAGIVEHDPSDQAVTLDGTTGEIIVDHAAVPSALGTIEMVATIKSLPAAGQWMSIMHGPGIGGQFSPHLSIGLNDAGELIFYRTAPDPFGDSAAARTTTGLTAGTYHLAFTWEAQSGVIGPVDIYVDGVLQPDTNTSGIIYDVTNQDVSIGGNDGRSEAEFGRVWEFFDGTIGEVVFYDSRLSSTRIAAHASAVATPWNGDTSGTRVGRMLDLADWPTADRDLDAGQTTFADANFNDDQTVLEYLHRCAESESGLFFVDRTGNARFIERHASITDVVYAESQATFSDSPSAGEYNYETFEPDYDDQLVNIATFQRKFGVTQSAEDAASRAAYGDAELTRTALLMDTDAEAKSAAEWVVAHNAEPRMEVRRIAVHPELNSAVWPEALGLDLLERVTVERTPKHGGDAFTQEASIQGVSHRIRPTGTGPGWVTGWWLSPVDTQAYWILGDATYSVLGSTTRLAY